MASILPAQSVGLALAANLGFSTQDIKKYNWLIKYRPFGDLLCVACRQPIQSDKTEVGSFCSHPVFAHSYHVDQAKKITYSNIAKEIQTACMLQNHLRGINK